MSDIITAPFTDDQVRVLNRYQREGLMHPFTCPSDKHVMRLMLVATRDGWKCLLQDCDYTQDWAHAFMADEEWMNNHPLAPFIERESEHD